MKSSTRPLRKRNFLLLEVLISLTLVLIVLGATIKPLSGIVRGHFQRFEKDEVERVFRALKSEVKERLYMHHHSWSQLEEGKAEGSLKPRKVGNREYIATYSMEVPELETKKSGDRYLLTQCKIALHSKGRKSHEMAFPVLVERRGLR